MSAAECDRILDQLSEANIKRSRAGARHLLSLPFINQLATDPRLLNIAGNFLGQKALPFRVTLFDKSYNSNWLVFWHQDTALPMRQRFEVPGWGPWSVKIGIFYAHAPTTALSQIVALRVHLDDSTTDNGPLRVLPGTHMKGVLTDEDVLRLAHSMSSVECIVPKGGVLAMRPMLIHSSSKSQNSAPRRVLHIEYARSLILAPGIELAVA